jgi:cytochrome d ubiquinol oxidase subunit II
LLGGLTTCGIFLLHGVAFLALKTAGEVRDNTLKVGRWLALPVLALAGTFGLWTQFDHGKTGSWVAFGIAVLALLGAVMLLRAGTRDGWAFVLTTVTVLAVVTMLFVNLYPNVLPSTLNPDWNLTIYNTASNPYTLKVMTWAAAIFTPLVIGYQSWTYWVFRQRISADRIPASIGLAGRRR